MYCKTENLVYVSFVTHNDKWISYNKLKHPLTYYPSNPLSINPITQYNVVYASFVTYSDVWTVYSATSFGSPSSLIIQSYSTVEILCKRSWSIC